MNLTGLAREAIIAKNIIPDEDVLLDVVNPHWDGMPKLYIVTEPTQPADETQFGAISAETILKIVGIAEDRHVASGITRQAVSAFHEAFTELEQTPRSGILCVTFIENNLFQIPERSEFQAFFSFRILHNPTL